MQETRRHILDILRETGQATVDDIVNALCERREKHITAVTVRHHLKYLQEENLITAPQLRHRSSPGRPQHVYMLTEKAEEYFPNNYQRLAKGLLEQMQRQLSAEGVNVILQGVAEDMAAEASIGDVSLEKRMERVVDYLNQQGYEATYEKTSEGYILSTNSCPYHQIATSTESLCSMDMHLISTMLGIVPRMLSRVSQGDPSCTYLIPAQS
ncbi:MAG: transcriptional regulator [Anaerolineae bacterium]